MPTAAKTRYLPSAAAVRTATPSSPCYPDNLHYVIQEFRKRRPPHWPTADDNLGSLSFSYDVKSTSSMIELPSFNSMSCQASPRTEMTEEALPRLPNRILRCQTCTHAITGPDPATKKTLPPLKYSRRIFADRPHLDDTYSSNEQRRADRHAILMERISSKSKELTRTPWRI